MRRFHFEFSNLLCIELALIVIVSLGSLQLVEAPPIEPPWTDFAMSGVRTTPLVPGAGDPVIFGVEVRILGSNMGPREWVDIHCYLDGKLWDEEEILVTYDNPTEWAGWSAIASEVHSQVPWTATLGSHVVTWVVDPDYMYRDIDRENNEEQHSFSVGERSKDFDFGVSVSPSWRAVTVGESTSYEINLYAARVRMERVYLTVEELPLGLDHSFSQVSGLPSYSSVLKLTCSQVPLGAYHLRVVASGETRSHSVAVVLHVGSAIRGNSSISVSANPLTLTLGKNVTVHGAIMPPHNATVTLRYIRPDGLTFMMGLKSESDGRFIYSFEPDSEGVWVFSVAWTGDSDYLGAQSRSVTVLIETEPISSIVDLVRQLEAGVVIPLNPVAVRWVIMFLVMVACVRIVMPAGHIRRSR